MLDQAASEAGACAWVEKTPDHVFYVDSISRTIPGARFIHVIRDGRAVVASLYSVTKSYPRPWNGPWSIEKCILHWNNALRASLTALGQSARIHQAVRYEQLVSNPEASLVSVCHFLDLRYSTDMLERYRESFTEISRSEEAWKSKVDQPIEYRGLENYRTTFSKEQRSLIESRLLDIPDEIWIRP